MTLALVLFCHNQSKTALTLFHDIQLLKKLLARHVLRKNLSVGRGRGRGTGYRVGVWGRGMGMG